MLAPLTSHARVRMQQRGVPPAALDVLLEYVRHLDAYAVLAADDAVVTVGHRLGRWPR
jgi:hypothetical protein